MTDEQLREIEERANAATPGAWVVVAKGNSRTVMADRHVSKDLGYRWKVAVFAGDPKSGDRTDANGEFIAHAREDIPALIAEIRELQQANLRLSIAANGY